MELNLKATRIFNETYNARERFIVNQGGTGSSKSYSLAQLFVVKPYGVKNKVFSVVRKSMPSLRATAMRDFFNILEGLGIYDEANHNKTENIYHINGNEIEFFGLDEPQKVRSRRRDYLWINEANELSQESFRQLNMRTNVQVFMDFNPSDEFHWIYDDILTRKDSKLIISTYKDNPFLPREVIKEIEQFKELDPNYWNIYGLGQRGASQVRIYTAWDLIDDLPYTMLEDTKIWQGEHIYGLDFGWNHPTSLCEVVLKDDDVYSNEVIYESFLTNADVIQRMGELEISKKDYIFADSAEPQRIEEIKKAGYNIYPADKDVIKGIDTIKSHRLYITKNSVNAIKELKSYSWKTKDERVLDEPVKIRDDFCFTGDTMVGNKRIDEIGQLTGFRDVFEYNIAGVMVKATPDHPVLTQRGFVPIDTLRYNDVVWQKQSFMTVTGGTDIPIALRDATGLITLALERLIQARGRDYIDMYGEGLSVKSLRGITYIIKTMTPQIMTLATCFVLAGLNTFLLTGLKSRFKQLRRTLRKLFSKHLGGQVRQRVKGEDEKSERTIPSISPDIRSKEGATCVGKSMSQRPVLAGGVTTTAKQRRYAGQEPVWGLKTKSGMYRANGLVVSNCDSLRYAVHSFATRPKKAKAYTSKPF